MPCFRPLKGWRSLKPNSNGKYPVVFDPNEGHPLIPMDVPCGQCVGCRLARSGQWAVRCVHEAQQWKQNCFITLTYNVDHLPTSKSVSKREWQLFMKKLRKRFGSQIRFFMCGEYGERNARPHYHACLFNFDFPDKKFWKNTRGVTLYTSETLNDIWGNGYCVIGDVNFKSAAYVARYIMKKVNGDVADEHYTWVDYSTGEVFNCIPEFTLMSRRPGIARDWYDKFYKDVYPSDEVVINGKRLKPPKYYDNLYDIDDPVGMKEIKRIRKLSAKKHLDNCTGERMVVREKVCKARLSLLKRADC